MFQVTDQVSIILSGGLFQSCGANCQLPIANCQVMMLDQLPYCTTNNSMTTDDLLKTGKPLS